MAVTLHQLLDGFLVLEKKLEEGQEVGAPRAHPFLAELRQRMDKFVKKLSGQDMQVSVGMRGPHPAVFVVELSPVSSCRMPGWNSRTRYSPGTRLGATWSKYEGSWGIWDPCSA